MSLDLIEIALNHLSDHVDFEKLASEIMFSEGYRNIKPLGGVSDKGIDAVQEIFYINVGRIITVFQYSLVKYVPGKIRDTIEKLNRNKIEFQELVIVTPISISAEIQDDIKRDVRNLFDININIYERKTLVNRLSDSSNGIFSRHFPDIEKQVSALISRKPYLSAADASLLEMSMLKSSLVFSMGKDSSLVRDTTFDSLTFSIISGINGDDISVADVLSEYREKTGMHIPPSQLESSLKRLSSKGLLTRRAEYIKLTKFAKQYEQANTIRANDATESLIYDVLQQIAKITDNTVTPQELEVISTNTREILIKLFTLFGLELAEKILKEKAAKTNYFDLSEGIISTAKAHLSTELGNLLVSTISDVLKHPTEEQAQTLSYWSLSYVGVQLMNIDPNLRQLQAVRFSKKTFVLDTDFILDCVVRECPLSRIYLELVNTLINFGCRIIIPTSCIGECINHAKISPRTYHHFGNKLLSLMDIFVDEVVWNIFVKGYYFGRINNEILATTNYNQYLKNYYEPRSPESYFIELLKETFPDGTEIIDISKLKSVTIPDKLMKDMTQELINILSSGLKSQYRSTENIAQLADIDANLFLSVLSISQSDEGYSKDEILGGCCYLITSSNKYLRASRKIVLRDVVTARPQALVALLDVIGGIKIEPHDFVLLFENPLIINAVQQAWDDVEQLLDSGIDLHDKSLSRLRWDLDQGLHSKISALISAESQAASTEDESDSKSTDEKYTDLIKSASEQGYRNIPELDVFLRELQAKDMKVEELEQAYNDLLKKFTEIESQISHFGKRKQNYLRRMAGKK